MTSLSPSFPFFDSLFVSAWSIMFFVVPRTPMDHLLRGSHRMQQSGQVLYTLHSTMGYEEFKDNLSDYTSCRHHRIDLEKLIDATFLSGKLSTTVNQLAAEFHVKTKSLLESAKLESDAAQLADKARIPDVSSIRIVTTKALLGSTYREFINQEGTLVRRLEEIRDMKSKKPEPERVPRRRFAPSSDNEGRSVSITSQAGSEVELKEVVPPMRKTVYQVRMILNTGNKQPNQKIVLQGQITVMNLIRPSR
ncbi:hypothetical protein ARMGADRAFT_827064 [Armillaria gallica]|uniref:Uncharacterized protein n=1 Tax=Armillaria gallica TaxID=47427 RepID=A0A2H3CV28_ARMGA|nr:hypothetical protein ARMGADRAFT_827064 [Armillaria gallica]